jgi:hypothetical protein
LDELLHLRDLAAAELPKGFGRDGRAASLR